MRAKTHVGRHVKYQLLFSDLNKKSADFSETPQHQISLNSRVLHADRRTDMAKIFGAFLQPVCEHA
jgi:ribonuclease PH